MMMREARRILPTDLLPLVSFSKRRRANEAWTRERLGAAGGSLPIGTAFDQLFGFAGGRSGWISVRRQQLRGLVGARRRGARQAWEIDCLIDATPELDVLPALLECAVKGVGHAGAEKLFLRLACESQLLPAVRDLGFLPFREEGLYARVGLPDAEPALNLRPLSASDSYLAYRLYNATTPEATRRNEAATFGEWHACREQRWLRNSVQLVREGLDGIDSLVSAARLRQGAIMELLVGASARDVVPALIRSAGEAVSGEGLPIFVLAPSFSGLERQLEDLGFARQSDYVSLVRRTTRPLTLPKLSPAIVKTAIGV